MSRHTNHEIGGEEITNVHNPLVTTLTHTGRNNSLSGFTILEIIISIVIVAISITAFIQLLGNSTRFRVKLNDYDIRYNVAITKADQAFLGLLDGSNPQVSDDKIIWQGTTEDSGIDWYVEEVIDEDSEENNRSVYFYTVSVGGIEISSVSLR